MNGLYCRARCSVRIDPNWIATIDTIWNPTPQTKIMTPIAQITGVAGKMVRMVYMLKRKRNIAESDRSAIIDRYQDVRDDVHIYMNMEWDKECKEDIAENLNRRMDVLTRT